MVRVEDADRAIGWYARKLGYDVFKRWEADTFANFHMGPTDRSPAAMSVELTYNYDGRTYTMGDAWGHLAVRAGDLHDAWETLVERDAEDYRDPASCDDRYAFTKDADGHEVEVVTE
jgi:lactoylglutathione lyase